MNKTIKPGTEIIINGTIWIVGEPLEEGSEKEELLDIFNPLIKA